MASVTSIASSPPPLANDPGPNDVPFSAVPEDSLYEVVDGQTKPGVLASMMR